MSIINKILLTLNGTKNWEREKVCMSLYFVRDALTILTSIAGPFNKMKRMPDACVHRAFNQLPFMLFRLLFWIWKYNGTFLTVFLYLWSIFFFCFVPIFLCNCCCYCSYCWMLFLLFNVCISFISILFCFVSEADSFISFAPLELNALTSISLFLYFPLFLSLLFIFSNQIQETMQPNYCYCWVYSSAILSHFVLLWDMVNGSRYDGIT